MTSEEARDYLLNVSYMIGTTAVEYMTLKDGDKIREAIKVLGEQEWIPLSEQLPEDGTWNIFTDGKNISVERYKMDALDHFWPNGRWFEFDEAVAWMPLPEPYKAESEVINGGAN